MDGVTVVDTRRPNVARRPTGPGSPVGPGSTTVPGGTLVRAAHARRRLGLAGSVAVALGTGVLGVIIALAEGSVTHRIVPVSFVVGSVAASLLCRRADLRRLLVALPLVWFAIALGGSLADVIRLGAPLGLTSLGIPAGELAVLDAPYLWTGFVLAFLIAAARRGVARNEPARNEPARG